MESGQRLLRLEAHPQFARALKIIEHLALSGHHTVLAGGCVRDSLLGVNPKDLDLATGALPEQVEAAFARTINVGKAFGTIVVVEDGYNFEVTTFRTDGQYLNGRHPETVSFANIEEDAKRRDFTVNALFYDPLKPAVIDLVGGQVDLDHKRLRTVGEPAARFGEDRLRMLRAVRFVAQLGFELDQRALEAIKHDHQEIKKVSVERVLAELKRLLESKHVIKGLDVLQRSNLHLDIWPELFGLKLERLLSFSSFLNWENAFAAICLLQNISDPEPRLRAWKASKESIKRVQVQLRSLSILKSNQSTRADRARIFGGEVYAEVMILAEGVLNESQLKNWVDEYLEIADSQGQLPRPLVTGEDLLSVNIAPGAEMGRYLKLLYDAQLGGGLHSKSEALQELGRLRAKGEQASDS